MRADVQYDHSSDGSSGSSIVFNKAPWWTFWDVVLQRKKDQQPGVCKYNSASLRAANTCTFLFPLLLWEKEDLYEAGKTVPLLLNARTLVGL